MDETLFNEMKIMHKVSYFMDIWRLEKHVLIM